MNLETLVKMSNEYGSNSELVLAGGGNTSMKTQNTIYIKASGTALSTITSEGFIEMSRRDLDEMFEKDYPQNDKEREAAALADLMNARINKNSTKRPSVETLLHSLFAYAFVLHLHPALINGLTCSLYGEQATKKLFGEKIIWIEPYRPGFSLATLCRDRMKEYKEKTGKDAQIVFLQNHGVFFSADTVEEIDSLLNMVQDDIKSVIKEKTDIKEHFFNTDKVSLLSEEIVSLSPEKHVVFNKNCAIGCFIESKIQSLMKPLTPDQIVYCRAYPLYIADETRLKSEFVKYRNYHGYTPRIFILKGLGFFAVGTNKKEAELANLLFYDAIRVGIYASNFGGVQPMSDDLINFIVNWEAEAYRKSQI